MRVLLPSVTPQIGHKSSYGSKIRSDYMKKLLSCLVIVVMLLCSMVSVGAMPGDMPQRFAIYYGYPSLVSGINLGNNEIQLMKAV